MADRRLTGDEVPYVIPSATLLIEGPAALVEPSIKRHGNREVAEAFLAFLRSDEAQRILSRYGFRPLDAESHRTGPRGRRLRADPRADRLGPQDPHPAPLRPRACLNGRPYMTRSSAQACRRPVSNSLYSASVGSWIVCGLKAAFTIRNKGTISASG